MADQITAFSELVNEIVQATSEHELLRHLDEAEVLAILESLRKHQFAKTDGAVRSEISGVVQSVANRLFEDQKDET